MAWADLLTRTTGDDITSVDWALLASALQERTGWVGDAAENTKADALPALVEVGDAIQAVAVVQAMQDIVEAICASFARTGTAYAVSNLYGSYTWATLAEELYTDHGSEASGIGVSGGVYDWIRRPTRDTSLLLGNPVAGDDFYYEHVRGIAFALDHLRYLHASNTTSSPKIFRFVTKGAPYPVSHTSALAWAAMKAATPSIINSEGSLAGCKVAEAHTWFSANDYRLLHPMTIPAWLVGHAPASWVDVKFLIRSEEYQTFHGPFELSTNVTNSAAGAYSTGSVLDTSFTLSGADALNEFTADTPNSHPKTSGSAIYVMVRNPTYDGGDPGEISESCSFTPYKFDLVLKPTTVYGT